MTTRRRWWRAISRDYREIYASRGWTMFDSIDRVYDAGEGERRLGFVCRTGFREILEVSRTVIPDGATRPPHGAAS